MKELSKCSLSSFLELTFCESFLRLCDDRKVPNESEKFLALVLSISTLGKPLLSRFLPDLVSMRSSHF